MAETIYYVDPDVPGGGAGDGSSWANAYSSLNTAENDRDANITGGNAVVFVCGHNGASQTTADTTAVSVSGWTTDADSYVEIRTETADRHQGVWTDTRYRLTAADTNALAINEEYVRVTGLQIRLTSTNANYQAPIQVATIGAANDIRISATICRQYGGTVREPGMYLSDAEAIITIWNCICYGSGSAASLYSAGICANAVSTVGIYNCTLIGGYAGLRVVAGTVTAKNCYAYGSNTAYSNAGTLTLTTCGSSDTTGSTGLQSIAYSTVNFTNVTATTEDLHLVVGSALIEGGTTLTDDPPGATALAVDIAGTTRS